MHDMSDSNTPPERDAQPTSEKDHGTPTPSVSGPVTSGFDGWCIQGLFSYKGLKKVGTGTTTRKVETKMYWYVRQVEDDLLEIQPLNNNKVPSGQVRTIPMDEFLDGYEPEPEYYHKVVFPKMMELDETVERAEIQRKEGAGYSAEFEYNKALDIDEENVRANFGLGLTYLDRGDSQRAKDIFDRLVGLEAAFSAEHKHLFNEFGISLRKAGLLNEAVEYYQRALDMTDTDENLHYNMARAYFEKGDAENTVAYLERCLNINPRHAEARDFSGYLKRVLKETGH